MGRWQAAIPNPIPVASVTGGFGGAGRQLGDDMQAALLAEL